MYFSEASVPDNNFIYWRATNALQNDFSFSCAECVGKHGEKNATSMCVCLDERSEKLYSRNDVTKVWRIFARMIAAAALKILFTRIIRG